MAGSNAETGDKVLIIVPTYNERDNIEPLAREVFAVLPRAHILVVDDNSPDGTGEVADRMAAEDERVHVLHRTAKEGLGRAYIAGFRWALERDYDFIFEMDADFSHRPEYLPRLLERARAGADLAIGSRYVSGGHIENWGPVRRLISAGGSLYSRTVLGVHVRDLTGGFKCFRRATLEGIDLDTIQTAGFGFQIEMTYRLIQRGFRVEEVPITFVDRTVGESKMSRKIFMEALLLVWKLRLGPKPA